MKSGSPLVLILGAGINGCALARELALNGVGVWLLDSADLASGATSGSSRLVHGGLRYLEYGEFDLVKESLAERTRLLRLAPQFVHPLRLWIPSQSRFGGLLGAPGRFFGWSFWPTPTPRHGRGVAVVRAGLKFYDAYARDPDWPASQCVRVAAPEAPSFDRAKYRWTCSYFDAQVAFPERLVVALLDDARSISRQQGLDFRVFTYHTAALVGDTVEIRPNDAGPDSAIATLEPDVIVNATGAWIDETLARLHVASDRLIGGTKGSHLFTFSQRLHDALAGQGVYAEARDGRPIFITPLADTILIGTTDLPFDGSPESVIATPQEQEYLVAAVNEILPDARLDASEIAFHCSAVRPLPYVPAATPAAITRRHSLVKNNSARVPLFSLVGGKLTTMRSLAEITAHSVLEVLGRTATANSRERFIPGGEDFPPDADALATRIEQIAGQTGFPTAAVAAVWQLTGTRAEALLAADDDRTLVADSDLPRAFVRQSIRDEWARTLSDLVERRLMLLYHQRLSVACLQDLAELLAEAGHLTRSQVDSAVDAEVDRLANRYARRVD